MAGKGKGAFQRVMVLKLYMWSARHSDPGFLLPHLLQAGTNPGRCLAQETPGIRQVEEAMLVWLGAIRESQLDCLCIPGKAPFLKPWTCVTCLWGPLMAELCSMGAGDSGVGGRSEQGCHLP